MKQRAFFDLEHTRASLKDVVRRRMLGFELRQAARVARRRRGPKLTAKESQQALCDDWMLTMIRGEFTIDGELPGRPFERFIIKLPSGKQFRARSCATSQVQAPPLSRR